MWHRQLIFSMTGQLSQQHARNSSSFLFYFPPSKGCNSTSVLVTPDAAADVSSPSPPLTPCPLPLFHAPYAAGKPTFSNTPSLFRLLVALILPAACNTLPTVYCTAASFSSLRFQFKCHLLRDTFPQRPGHSPLCHLSPIMLDPFLLSTYPIWDDLIS